MHIPDNRSKRTNLFLVRVWCDDDDENEHRDEDEGPCRIWHGRVQRTVSGEVHSFAAKADLIDVIESMLYKDREDVPGQGRPLEKPSPQANLSSHGNHTLTVD